MHRSDEKTPGDTISAALSPLENPAAGCRFGRLEIHSGTEQRPGPARSCGGADRSGRLTA